MSHNRRDRGATLILEGGGGTVSDSILGGGAQDPISYELLIILKILGGTCPPAPLLRGL